MTTDKNKKMVLFLFLAFFVFCSLPYNHAQAQTIIAPTIVSISAIDANTTIIRGTTVVNTDVMLFLDNKFVGSIATNLTKSTSTDIGFIFILKKNLTNGQHILSAIARDNKTQIISDYSQPFVFLVSERKKISIGTQTNNEVKTNLPPAPVLQDPPAVNNNGLIIVTGWAKNNLNINIFLDEKLLSSFPVKNSETGTANFSYTFRQKLASDGHLIYATATDNSGKESIHSNYLYYLAGVSKNNELMLSDSQDTAEQNSATEPAKTAEENKIESNADSALSDILESKQTTNEEKSGMVDESEEMQGKLKWNLIIFILFLIAVIAWIFWVNRELIKEKREQNKKAEEKNSQDKLV